MTNSVFALVAAAAFIFFGITVALHLRRLAVCNCNGETNGCGPLECAATTVTDAQSRLETGWVRVATVTALVTFVTAMSPTVAVAGFLCYMRDGMIICATAAGETHVPWASVRESLAIRRLK